MPDDDGDILKEGAWDCSEIYEQEFQPLVEELIKLARKHDIPLHITSQKAHLSDRDTYCTTHMPGTRSSSKFDRLIQVTVKDREAKSVLFHEMLRGMSAIAIPMPQAMAMQQPEDDGKPPVMN